MARNEQFSNDGAVGGLAHVDLPPTDSDTTGRKIALRGTSGEPWKKFMAFTVVVIMVAAGFVMLAPALAPRHTQAAPIDPQENQASISLGGPREVTYTISNMFESYQKQSDPTHSWQGAIPGMSSWWGTRFATMGDMYVRTVYPYVIGYNPYSAEVPGAGVSIPTMKYGLYTFYRTTIDARNLTKIGTGPDMEATFLPILYSPWTTGLGLNGGWMNFSYYMTYCTQADLDAASTGTGYARTYYGATPSQFNFQGANANDGWYIELQGKADFNMAAAKKFLGLTGSADLRTQFNANNTGANLGKMNRSLAEYWTSDGSNTGFNDTYCSYDFSIDYSPLKVFLSVDPSSTASKLVLRMYSIGWGLEYLMNRYLDRIGLMSSLVTSLEDWYLNGTVGPTGADVFSRCVSVYNMMAWKDPGFYCPAWQMEVAHIDYAPNNGLHVNTDGKWNSRYNPYMATTTVKPTYMSWTPGTLTYGHGVAYWYPPMNWNLLAGEKLTVKLPASSKGVLGYMPYAGTGMQDTLTEAKKVELQSHTVWGELGLGNLYPASLRSSTYYNHATKTLTITGPTSFPRNPNTAFPLLNATGSPSFQFDVMRVSDYAMAIQEPGPYVTGQAYHLTLTAKNVTGATVTNWNGTIDLTATTGTTLGATSLWFGPGSNGVVSTTMTFTANGAKTITATDRNNSLDVLSSLPVMVGPFGLTLVAGWNFISVPLAGYGYKASTLGLVAGNVVASWNSIIQSYHTYIVGISPPSANFAIAQNVGYWVWVPVAKTLPLSGIIPTTAQTYTFTVPTAGGWIALGLESMKATWHAEDVTTMYSGSGAIAMVAYYDAATSKYVSWISAVPALNNFPLAPGQAYWCWVTAGPGGTITYVP